MHGGVRVERAALTCACERAQGDIDVEISTSSARRTALWKVSGSSERQHPPKTLREVHLRVIRHVFTPLLIRSGGSVFLISAADQVMGALVKAMHFTSNHMLPPRVHLNLLNCWPAKHKNTQTNQEHTHTNGPNKLLCVRVAPVYYSSVIRQLCSYEAQE